MKHLLFFTFVLLCGHLISAEMIWNKENHFEGWKRFRFCTNKIENGILTLNDIAFDSCMINDHVDLDPADFNALSIRYRAEGITVPSTGEFYFVHGSEKYSESRRWNVPALISDGEWHTVTILPKTLDSWLTGGNISGLRIDMVNKPGGKIEISEIKLHKFSGKTAWSGEDLKQWNYFRNCSGEMKDGNIFMNITGTDSLIIAQGMDFDTTDCNAFVMVYRANRTPQSNGELYFAQEKENYSDARRWRLPALIADGEWHTMTVEDKALNNHDAWYNPKSKITKLRLDPTNAAGGTLEIKEIRFEKREGAKPLPKVSMKMDAPEWKPLVSQLKKNESDNAAYFTAKMIRAPQDLRTAKMMHPFFVRRKIVLKDSPAYAKLQFTADDYSQAVINGKDAAFSNSWRETVTCDVAQLLRKGENILGFQYYNKDAHGGVFGELYVQYPDGSSEKISTDKLFRSTDKEIKDWATVSVDDSAWDPVIEQPGPPNSPWLTTLNYTDFNDLRMITDAKVSGKTFQWGDTLELQLECTGKIPEEDVKLRVVLYSKDTTQWADTISIPAENIKLKDHGKWTGSFCYELPYYIPVGDYEIRLDSRQYSVAAKAQDNLKISLESSVLENPKFATRPVFQVVRTGTDPEFRLNGKPFYMSLAKCGSYYGDQSPKVSGKAPFSAVNPSPNYEKWNPRVGIYDFTEFDRVAAKIVRSYPDAYILIGLDLYIPANWHHKFQDDMAADNTGKQAKGYRFSFYSKNAAEELAKSAIKAIEHVENSPYANRVIGYRIGGGYTTEFLGWEPGASYDFSKCAQKGFMDFASKYYPELKDHKIPTQSERTSVPEDTLLWNPAEHLKTVAFFDSYSNANADLVIKICSAAKKYLKEQKIQKVIGTYFGYVATLNHTGVAQMRAHFALRRLLKANTVDFIMSPNSYPLRNFGDIVGDMKPFSSLSNHNIVSFIEDDTRTHNGVDIMSTPGSSAQAITEKQSIHLMRRNIGVALCRNQPENYNPMFDDHFNFKAMEKDIATRRVLGDFCAEKQLKRNAEVAIVISEKAVVSMPVLQKFAPSGYIQQRYRADGSVERGPLVKNIPNYEMYIGNQGRFARTGAPVDIILAEDLNQAKPYKVYAFLNCFNYDKEFLDTVKRLQQKNCTLLWVYAPGFAYQNTASVDAMKQLTGFTFNQLKESAMPAVRLPDGSYYGSPTVRVKPLFSVADKDASVLGKYEDGSAGLASKKIGNTLSYFSGPWLLELPFLSKVLKKSGVHIYSDSGDPLEANDSLVVFHARTPGKKKIRLPRKTNILDVYEKRIVAENTDMFEFDSDIHETRVFYYGDDAQELQKKLQESANK